MRVLISGGVGYIGSHTAKTPAAAGFDVFVVDNLSTGHGDYTRVCDLAKAHLDWLEYLLAGGESSAFNLGPGRGQSAAERVPSS
jgi:UDP-glucose 4-epimerase